MLHSLCLALFKLIPRLDLGAYLLFILRLVLRANIYSNLEKPQNIGEEGICHQVAKQIGFLRTL